GTRKAHVRRDLVLHRHVRHGGCATHRQLIWHSRKCIQKLFLVRRGTGCASAMVVRSQCRGLLSYHTLPGADVLLSAQGSQPSGLFVPTLHYPLLVAHLHLYMGRSAPPALHGPARLGAIARNGLFHYAHCAIMGWYAERTPHASWCMGPCSRRSRA